MTGWEGLGGVFDSPPAVASWGVNRLDIFGLGTNNEMYHKAWNGSEWLPSMTGWEALGGTFDSPPAVAAWAADRLDIFGLGTDNQMYHKTWKGSEWLPAVTAWDALGGVFDSAPAVASWGGNRLDIVGLGTDNQMYHKAWNGSAWLPSVTGWEALGGELDIPTPMPSMPAPASALGSNSNYILYNNCNPLIGLSVTIDVTQDIVCQSASGSTVGFGFQLNAYSPKNETSAWQQYVIALFGNIGAVDNWPVTGANIINDFFNLTSTPSSKLPAGYKLVISLENDQNSNITGATYVVIDAGGTTQANVTLALEVDLWSNVERPGAYCRLRTEPCRAGQWRERRAVIRRGDNYLRRIKCPHGREPGAHLHRIGLRYR